MSDFDVTFSNDTFDVALEDTTFDVTFENDDFNVTFDVEGAQGPQGRYYVKVYTRNPVEPGPPTTALRWLPDEIGGATGTLNGDSNLRDTDGNLIQGGIPWSLLPPSGSTQLWESEAVYNPADNTGFTNQWSSVFQGGAEGPPGPSGATYSFGDTSNNGTTLGVDFTVGTEVNGIFPVTATVDASGISGGGGNQLPSEHARINLNHTQFEQNSSGSTTVTGSITVDSPYTFAGTGESSGTGGNDTIRVTDGDGNALTVTHSSLSASTFTFVVTATEKQTLQTFNIAATIFATYNGQTYSQRVNQTLRIIAPIPHWYTTTSTSIPANNAAMTDEGNFTGTAADTFTGQANGSRSAYIALPTRSGGYNFKSGELFLTATTISSTYSQTGYTLYRIDDFIDGTANSTLTVNITEA